MIGQPSSDRSTHEMPQTNREEVPPPSELAEPSEKGSRDVQESGLDTEEDGRWDAETR